MPGAVAHVGDLARVRLAIGAWLQRIEPGAQGVHHLEVGLFVPAAHVVGFARHPALEHSAQRTGMVAHMEPVAHLLTVAIDRQRLARERVVDHQRNQLFRKLVGAVVVRAVAGEDGQAVGVVVGTHQVIACRLARRVRAVGLVTVQFGEGRVGAGERAVDLVGRDMEEAKRVFGGRLERAPVAARGLEQSEGAHHIGLDEGIGPVDRAVDMALGGKVHDGPHAMLGEEAFDQGLVGNVAVHEVVARIAFERAQILQVARVGEAVQVDDGLVVIAQPVQNEVAADEAGTAGDKQGHGSWLAREA